MKAGKLRHRVTFESRSEVQDSFGQPQETWPAVDTVWASIEQLSGQELFAAQQVNAETTTRVTIRYRAGLDESMRISFGDTVYNIHSIINPELKNERLVMMCGSGLNEG